MLPMKYIGHALCLASLWLAFYAFAMSMLPPTRPWEEEHEQDDDTPRTVRIPRHRR